MGTPAYRIPYDSADPIQSIFQDIKKGHFNFDMEGLKRRLLTLAPPLPNYWHIIQKSVFKMVKSYL